MYQVSRAQEIIHAKEWNVSISRTTNSGNHCSSGKCKSDDQRGINYKGVKEATNIVHHSRQELCITRVDFIQLQRKLQLRYGRVEGEVKGGKQ